MEFYPPLPPSFLCEAPRNRRYLNVKASQLVAAFVSAATVAFLLTTMFRASEQTVQRWSPALAHSGSHAVPLLPQPVMSRLRHPLPAPPPRMRVPPRQVNFIDAEPMDLTEENVQKALLDARCDAHAQPCLPLASPRAWACRCVAPLPPPLTKDPALDSRGPSE